MNVLSPLVDPSVQLTGNPAFDRLVSRCGVPSFLGTMTAALGTPCFSNYSATMNERCTKISSVKAVPYYHRNI